MFEATLDTSDFEEKLLKYATSVVKSSKKAIMDVGYEVLRLGEKEVPHDKGPLQTSGTVEPSKDDVVVGYNKEYAARLHEHPEYKFQKGRKAKYLEDPIINNIKLLREVIGKALNSIR